MHKTVLQEVARNLKLSVNTVPLTIALPYRARRKLEQLSLRDFFNFSRTYLLGRFLGLSWKQAEHREAAPNETECTRGFRVEEVSGGEPWIRLEPVDKDLRILGSGSLGF